MKKSDFIGLLLAVLILLGVPGVANSGVVYYDLASYNAATAGILWAEDFYYNGYQGPAPNPGQIAGGQAELMGTGQTSILWPASYEYVSQGATSIQGVSSTNLNVAAISFNFGNFTSPGQTADFNLVGGGTDSSNFFASQDDLFGRASGAIYFAGWVGAPGELLSNVSFENGVILDNIQASAVPVPAAVWLLGSGLIGIVGIRRKLKK